MSQNMMIKAKNIVLKERIWISREISKIMKQPLESDAQLHKERIIAVQEEPCLHVNLTSEMSQMKCGHSGNFPLCEPIQGVQDCTSECLVQVKGEQVY